MLTVPEAARRVGRNPETVRRWIREGKLAAQKVGTQHVIDERDLDAMSAGDVVGAPASWNDTATGEPMPDWVTIIRSQRAGASPTAPPDAGTYRINVALDDEHAAKLFNLAARTGLSPGTIARSLLWSALDWADPDPKATTELLDAIPGALEQAKEGLREARLGRVRRPEDL